MGEYKVILADPPWSYNNSRMSGAAANHYPTMTHAELCALPVEELAADDAVLFMWATWPLLDEAFALVNAWGFSYKTGLPWIKCAPEHNEDPEQQGFDFVGDFTLPVEDQLARRRPAWGQGFWVKACTEPIFICTRGKAKAPADPMLGLISNRFEHSRKPETIHELARGLEGPRLEMFARRRVDGFDLWGNQVPGGNDLEIKGAANA